MDRQENPFGAIHRVNWSKQTAEVKWANSCPWFGLSNHPHWSRRFEYPWVLSNLPSDPNPDTHILDAAGGKGELAVQLADKGYLVSCVDLDETGQIKHPRVKYEKGDISKLPYKKDSFDHVTCISVLEHTPNPCLILDELWRVLKPGGKLFISLDVASNRRYNHTIDEQEAEKILNHMGLSKLPEMSNEVLFNTFPELEPKPWEHKEVLLRVLCFWKVKNATSLR